MKEFTVTKNDAGQRLDRFCGKVCPGLPSSLLQKYFRQKDIKCNGHWAKPDLRLNEADIVRLYVPDEFFGREEKKSTPRFPEPKLDIVYEDENILLVNKKPGVLCHPASGWDPTTLVAHIQAHAFRRGEWDPRDENSFAPALCNRIDRGTGGIVIAAKNAETLRIMNQKIKDRELEKRYLCVCAGRPKPTEGTLKGWLFKDAVKNTVFVKEHPEPGADYAETRYRVLKSANGLSLTECLLITGRTHQIRVQMAHLGHPLLGDSKYGNEAQNRRYHENRQLLWSYKLRFCFTTDGGVLQYLNDREFSVPVPFVPKYFPESGPRAE